MNTDALPGMDWLTPARARLYGTALAGVLGGFLAWVGALTLLHKDGRPIALDFIAFWAAAHLAAAGHAAQAYDNTVVEAVERAAADMAPGYLAFYYPPTFLLLVLPLGVLGYGAGLAAFLLAETVLVVAALRRILRQSWAWLPLLSFPGFLMNGLSGQNAALSASCFAGAAIWLERRPVLAGACLGALACKPQLAPCVPVALLAARRWQALFACGLTACGLALTSWLALGTGVWRGFLANAPMARLDIETISLKWPKMQSVFGAIRLAGGGNGAAYVAQGVMSAAAVIVLVATCRRRPGAQVEAAALACGCLLFTPFLYDYDLAILAMPMACLMAAAQNTGWRAGEKILLTVLFLLPLGARAAGMGLGLIVGPPLIAALLLLLERRSVNGGAAMIGHAVAVPLPQLRENLAA